jgi:hypothetical protein
MSISEHFRYQNDVFQSDVFVSDIGITDGYVGCQISPKLRSTMKPTYGQDKQVGHKISVSKERAQSNSRTRPGWTYSRGAARDSCSSRYKCI